MNSYERQAELHKALAHPVRLRILDILSGEEACVCHITAILGKRQPYVSQQLALLKEANLIADRREGTLVYYRLQNQGVAALLTAGRSAVRKQGSLEVGVPQPALGPQRPIPGCSCPRCEQALEMETNHKKKETIGNVVS